MESRIDKFLWEVRLYKTRSQAAEACKKGQIFVSGVAAKASKMVRENDIIQVKRPPVVFSFKVLSFPKSRVGAKLVENHLLNTTTPDQLALLETLKMDKKNGRARGLGRPTKKERRNIDEFTEQPYFDDGWELD
ncbi:MAG: RNA-binding S4 domain-containing protein [Prevotellaceae bacterium]|jgi:ribosome-associated heat shock protein Hsp15|nr:RNA-binding S4 domain-containing protein [Prevotellaceae bacterium]